MRAPRLLLAVTAGLLAAGCSSSSSSSSGGSPASPSDTGSPSIAEATDTPPADVSPSAVETSAVANPSPSVAATSAASAAPVVDRCHTSQLRVSLGDSEGAAGTIFNTALLLNTSKVTCKVFGYPGLGLRASGGTDLPSKVVRGGGMLPATATSTITLAPAVSASFSFTYSDNPTGSDTQAACRQASTLIVTPPDERDPLTVPFSGAPCEGTLHVSPVVSGTRGVQP